MRGGRSWSTRRGPVVTGVAVATREPHLVVLSVMAHGRDPDVRTVVAVATPAATPAAGLVFTD
jgi:hypothetical protein